MVAALLAAALTAAAGLTCRFDGQPPAEAAATDAHAPPSLTCTPPSSIGTGEIDLVPSPSSAATYLDAQTFSYQPSPASDAFRSSPSQPGRQAKFGLVSIRSSDGRMSVAEALANVEEAGKQGADMAVLPEEFAEEPAQPLDGPLVQSVAAIARRHAMYVAFGMRQLWTAPGDPAANSTVQLNTAVVLARNGSVLGSYDKFFPVAPDGAPGTGGEVGVTPGWKGSPMLDLDFGRVGLAICFDVNFPEVWKEGTGCNHRVGPPHSRRAPPPPTRPPTPCDLARDMHCLR